MMSSVSSTNSLNATAFNPTELLAQVRAARQASRVDTVANAVEPGNVRALYNDYIRFFIGDTETRKVGLEEIESVLKDQFNTVLSLVSSKKTYGFPLDIAKILDENKLDKACKKGNEAYKFYVRKIISELNSLHEIVTSAKDKLSKLQTLIRREDFENPAVRELLTQLRIAETDGEAIKKTFSEYMVPKNFDITYFDFYFYNGNPEKKQTASTAQSTAQGSEAYTMPENTEINWDTNKDWIRNQSVFPSVIPDGISSVSDLRTKITTGKQTGSRAVVAYYFKKGTTDFTDRYDTNADVHYYTEENNISTENTEISFFGELTLLDKLKYIILYYTKDGDRRTFPENDDINGFPCLSNPAPTGINPATREDRKYTDDINEIAHLEPFYIGFLVDRDGPVNALASFMEIKSAAIGEQIKVLGYRVKALRYYLRLINRGLEEVNKSQSNGNARIPNSAYEILTMVGCNPTRCLKTIDGRDYFVLQWNGDKGEASYHTSPNNKYMLVRADDEGIEEFIKHADVHHCDDNRVIAGFGYFYNHIFKDSEGVQTKREGSEAGGFMLYHGLISRDTWNYIYGKKKWNLNIKDFRYELDGENKLYWEFTWWLDKNGRVPPKDQGTWSLPIVSRYPNVNRSLMRVITEPDESKLPRELETNRMNITTLLNQNYSGNKWNNYKNDKSGEAVWASITDNWKKTYDTVIGNIQAQLESVNKSIESLRNKINTFDTSAMNFRNKAYTIYNKTVNNIA